MTSDVEGLVEELRAAFWGPGLRDHSWRPRVDGVGNQLTRLAGVDALDPDPVATKKVTEWMWHTISEYPDDAQTVLSVAAAIHPTIRHDKLGAREDALASRLEKSQRTVKRRISDALAQLAWDGIANHRRAVAADQRGHVVTKLDALLRLDLDPPVVTERELIKVTGERLDSIVRPVSVPHDAEMGGGYVCEVLRGGTLRSVERRPGNLDHLLLHIEPSRVLEQWKAYPLEIRYTVRPRPFLIVSPQTPYDHARLEVRFPPDRQPQRVRRLDGAATLGEAGELLPSDPSGRYEAVFFGLRQGFHYGLHWDEAGPATA